MEDTLTHEQLVKILNEMLNKRYSKRLLELNKGVMFTGRDENGLFLAPVITLPEGGLTEKTVDLTTDRWIDAKTYTFMQIRIKPVKTFTTVRNIAFPYSELEIASKNENYFNHIMEKTIDVAIEEHIKKYGSYEKIRFGDHFISFLNGFRVGLDDAGEYHDVICLRLTGNWALDEEA